MPERTTPYSPDEQRVCEYLQELTKNQVGCGDDPIGFLIASHTRLRHHFRAAADTIIEVAAGRCYECGGSLTVACLACLTADGPDI